MFMDPSRAFDSINQNLLVAKLEPYDFSGISLQLMRTYLKNCKQRVHVKRSFSESKNVNYMVLNADKCHYMCSDKATENDLLMGILTLIVKKKRD